MKVWQYLDEALALVIVVGCITLIGLGINSEVKAILSVAAGWVFGKRFATATQKRKKED